MWIFIYEIAQIIQKMSFDSIVTSYIAILGIFVTLVSISISLNKEIRQKLLVKYFMKDFWIRSYCLLYVISSVIIFASFFFSCQYENEARFILLFAIFIATIGLVAYFIWRLNREYFYKLVLDEIETSFKEKDNERLKRAKEDLISNIGFVQLNNAQLDEETRVFEQFIDMSIKYKKTTASSLSLIDPLEHFIMETKPFDQKLLDTYLNALYALKLKKPIKIENLIRYQDVLYLVINRAFFEINGLNPTLNTSGLYIREFADIRTLDIFEKTADEREIQNFARLRQNTIACLYRLNVLIINANMTEEAKKVYLITQLSELNKALEYLDMYDATRFCKDYYDYKFKGTHTVEIKLVDSKLAVLNELTNNLQLKKEEIFFLILGKIAYGDLPKSFFEIALKIYYLGDFKTHFLKMQKSLDLTFAFHDTFSGGAQFMPQFNFARYKLLIFFYEYQKDAFSLDVFDKLEKDQFLEVLMPFEKEIDAIDVSFIIKYFDVEPKKLNAFKKAIKKHLKEMQERLKIDENKYLSESSAKKEYVDKFIYDVKRIWTENQDKLKKFIHVQPVTDLKGETSFGQYRLFSKEWFLDSFYKGISMSRDAGLNFGSGQIAGKNIAILDKFIEKLTKKTLQKKNFVQELGRLLLQNRIYYFAYNRDDLTIYTLDKLVWVRDDQVEAELTINNSLVKFLTVHPKDKNVLFEERAIILKQNKCGFSGEDDELVIRVTDNFTEDEIKKLIATSPDKSKARDELKRQVKIRVAERFEVQKDPSKEAYEIILV